MVNSKCNTYSHVESQHDNNVLEFFYFSSELYGALVQNSAYFFINQKQLK